MSAGGGFAKTSWPAVFAVYAAGVAGGAAVGKMAPALPLASPELGLSLVASGWLVSIFNSIALVAAVFFGVAADRVGAIRSCLAGLVCMAVGSVLGAIAPNVAMLFASRVIEGIGFVAIVVAAPALVTAATAPSERGVAFGLWSGYMPMGSALIIAASPLAIASWGWRGLWWLLAIATIAIALAIVSVRGRLVSASAGTPRSIASIRESFKHPMPWLLGICFAMYALQFHAIMIWLPTYLKQTRQLEGMVPALLTALFCLVNCGGNVFGGWLVQRAVPRGIVIGSTFVITSLLFLGMFTPGIPDAWRYGFVLAYAFSCGPVPAAAVSGGARYARSSAEVGAFQGLIMQITNVGIFFGPPIVAAVVSASGGWDATRWVLLGAAAIALVAAAVMHRVEHRLANPSSSIVPP